MGSKSGSFFRYADRIDKLLMLFGTLGSIGDGMMTPVTMLLLSDLINEYGSPNSAPSNDKVDKVTNSYVMHVSIHKTLYYAMYQYQ